VQRAEKAKAEIERLAARGKISLTRDGGIAFPMKADVYNAQVGAIAFGEIADAIATIAFLQAPALLAAANAAIDAAADDKIALSIADRERRASTGWFRRAGLRRRGRVAKGRSHVWVR
jgi:hypothetical protein